MKRDDCSAINNNAMRMTPADDSDMCHANCIQNDADLSDVSSQQCRPTCSFTVVNSRTTKRSQMAARKL